VAAPRFVLGAGNPGPEYEGTRHNAGFDVADRLAARLRAPWRSFDPRGFRAEGATADGPFVLLKPGTYMNRVGDVASALLDEFGPDFDPARFLVVVDDLALPPGRLRLRRFGSDGGHNGLRAIRVALKTDQFPRLRAGIGGVPAAVWSEYVLARPTAEEASTLNRAYARAAEIAEGFLRGVPFEVLAAEAERALPRVPDPATGGDDSGGARRPVDPDRGARRDSSSLTGDVQ
jgi:peptidyl-tRNA hydrolase, PTH1 family